MSVPRASMPPIRACHSAGPLRRFLRLAVLLAVAMPAVRADTITQTQGFRLNGNTAAATLHFAAFDELLGTLDGVDISFAATRRHAWAIWNVSGAPAALPYEGTLTDTTFTLDGVGHSIADLSYGPATTPVLASTGFPDFLAQFQAGEAQFLSGLEPDFGPGAFQPGTVHTAINGAWAAASFASVLNLAYAYDPGVFAIGSSGYFAGSLVDIHGDVTVTYRYTPHRVPDQAATLGLLALAAGLGAAARRWRIGSA